MATREARPASDDTIPMMTDEQKDVPVDVPDVHIPTLADAFHTLCRAMHPLFEDDIPAQMHCDDIRGFYDNGNYATAWAHGIQLLERLLGATVTQR